MSDAEDIAKLFKSMIPFGPTHFMEEDLPFLPKQNECACAYSASMVIDTWSAMLHELATDPLQGVLHGDHNLQRKAFWHGQVNKHCGLSHVFQEWEDVEERPGERTIFKDSLDKNLPGGHKNLDNLSDAEVDKAVRATARTLALALSMQLGDWQTMLRNCSMRRPEEEEGGLEEGGNGSNGNKG